MNNYSNKFSNKINFFFQGLILSYSQIFFSNSLIFGAFTLFLSFFHFNIGICGFISTLTSNILSQLILKDKLIIKSGYFNFNSLLVGLGLGSIYKLDFNLLLLIVFSSSFTFFVHLYIESLSKNKIFYPLSFPFFLVFSLISFILKKSNLTINEKTIFIINNYFEINQNLANLYIYLNKNLSDFFSSFFKAISSIIFIEDVLIGFLLFLFIFFYSRISAFMSFIGFIFAYLFISFLKINQSIPTFYLGFNIILLSIAIGGYFIIPSIKSILVVIYMSIVCIIFTIFLNEFLSILQINSYSLPFIVLTNFSLIILKKYFSNTIHCVFIQKNKPEINYYFHKNLLKRFKNYYNYIPIILPFLGKWRVWQDYNGKITHIGEYKYALDFILTDEKGKTYKNKGEKLEDYYSYGQYVLAPANGYVVNIENKIYDNEIGEVNIKQNWGNTIVIKHTENIYSQLSHLQKDNIFVKIGDYVYCGQIIGKIGNSGRSPEPHLHFQIQNYPNIGTTPIPYPFVRYLLHLNNTEYLAKYKIPKENDIIENVYLNPKLSTAFNFIPGSKFKIIISKKNFSNEFPITILTDPYNKLFLYCEKTNSYLYTFSDYYAHYFTDYIGNKKSPLFFLLLALFQVEFSDVKHINVIDQIPSFLLSNKLTTFLYDLIAPFYDFLSYTYEAKYFVKNKSKFKIYSKISLNFFNKKILLYKFESYIDNKIRTIEEKISNTIIKFIWD